MTLLEDGVEDNNKRQAEVEDKAVRVVGGRRVHRSLKRGRTVIPPVPIGHGSQCEVYLGRKGRYCSFKKVIGRDTCQEHSTGLDGRVACPLDGSHTVAIARMKKHMRICPAAKGLQKQQAEPWYVEDINAGRTADVNTATVDKAAWAAILQKVQEARTPSHYSAPPEIPQDASDFAAPDAGTSTRRDKHERQQGKLVALLRKAGLLDTDNKRTCYIELGCGAAELSKCVSDAIKEQSLSSQNCSFILVDRKAQRGLADRTIDAGPVERLKVDIKDLALHKIHEVEMADQVVVYSKHLCGQATDLGLRALRNLNAHQPGKIRGIFIAFCCHSACRWHSFVVDPNDRQDWWKEEEFQALTQMSGWATSRRKTIDGADSLDEATVHYTGMSVSAREEAGYQIKRLFDQERLRYCQEFLDLDCKIITYIERQITLENTCLVCT